MYVARPFPHRHHRTPRFRDRPDSLCPAPRSRRIRVLHRARCGAQRRRRFPGQHRWQRLFAGHAARGRCRPVPCLGRAWGKLAVRDQVSAHLRRPADRARSRRRQRAVRARVAGFLGGQVRPRRHQSASDPGGADRAAARRRARHDDHGRLLRSVRGVVSEGDVPGGPIRGSRVRESRRIRNDRADVRRHHHADGDQEGRARRGLPVRCGKRDGHRAGGSARRSDRRGRCVRGGVPRPPGARRRSGVGAHVPPAGSARPRSGRSAPIPC